MEYQIGQNVFVGEFPGTILATHDGALPYKVQYSNARGKAIGWFAPSELEPRGKCEECGIPSAAAALCDDCAVTEQATEECEPYTTYKEASTMAYVIRFTDTTPPRYFAGIFTAKRLEDAKTWKTRKAATTMLARLTHPAVVVALQDERARVQ